jgi:hypothetical protein
MKMTISLLLIAAFSAAPMLAQQAADDPVRHVVVFKYKADATDDQIAQVTDAFRALQNTIPGITSFEYGTNMSPEGHDDGFTHVYLVTFESTADRDAYLPHPEHEKFGALLGELDVLDDVFVVDYVPQP